VPQERGSERSDTVDDDELYFYYKKRVFPEPGKEDLQDPVNVHMLTFQLQVRCLL
jgi:hypothetical protein